MECITAHARQLDCGSMSISLREHVDDCFNIAAFCAFSVLGICSPSRRPLWSSGKLLCEICSAVTASKPVLQRDARNELNVIPYVKPGRDLAPCIRRDNEPLMPFVCYPKPWLLTHILACSDTVTPL